MSYTTLAQRLNALAGLLETHASRLEGAAMAKAATSFSKALATFEKRVEANARGNDPDIEDIKRLSSGPAKKLLKPAVWQKLLRETFSRRIGEGTSAQLSKEFIRLASESGRAADARAALDRTIRELSVPVLAIPKEKALLQAEFLRIGGLTEEEALVEFSTRWKKLTDLKNLAKHNAIVLPNEVKRDRIEREILHYARRAHSNVRA